MAIGPMAAMGRRIRAAREARGWSQADLAQRLGRTPAAISYWEGGLRIPGLEDILRVADTLGMPAADLLPSRSPRVVARAEAARLAMGDLTSAIDRIAVRFADRDLPSLRRLPTATNPAEMASIVGRESEQAKPPVDVVDVMSGLGVSYLEEQLPDPLSGFMIFFGLSPVVVVNASHAATRQHFTAAHELGHILLGHHDDFHLDLSQPEGVPPGYNWRHEREANEFASTLLMPAAWLRRDVESNVDLSIPALAKRFGVSPQAMGIRLSTLGLLQNVAGETLELQL